MHRGRRVVVVTPAGRRRYMELLVPQLLAYRDVVDEYRIWINTANRADIEYFEALAAEHPGFVTLARLPPGVPVRGNLTICHFFRACVDPDTVYVRFDDDVVLLDTLDAFRAFLDFRIDHPQLFLVYGTVLNNAVVAHVQQRFGLAPLDRGAVGYGCMDAVGWKCPKFAEGAHRHVLGVLAANGGKLEGFRMPNWLLFHYERVSINCISWLGEEFAKFGGVIERDEEKWLSVIKPRQLSKPNCIFGGYVVVHYAFAPQRAHLEATDVLAQYYALLGKEPPPPPEPDKPGVQVPRHRPVPRMAR